jgi:hypothetical protein
LTPIEESDKATLRQIQTPRGHFFFNIVNSRSQEYDCDDFNAFRPHMNELGNSNRVFHSVYDVKSVIPAGIGETEFDELLNPERNKHHSDEITDIGKS